MAVESASIRTRKNGAAGSDGITVNEGQTGQFEDTTNSTAFVGSDDINYAIVAVGTTGNMSLAHVGVMILNTDGLSNIKTINGLALASVKTVKGVAIADVQTWNGLE